MTDDGTPSSVSAAPQETRGGILQKRLAATLRVAIGSRFWLTTVLGIAVVSLLFWAYILLQKFAVSDSTWSIFAITLALIGFAPLGYAWSNWDRISGGEPKDYAQALGGLASMTALALGGSFAVVRFGQIETQIHAEHLTPTASFCKINNTIRTGTSFGIRNTGNVAFSIKWSCVQVYRPPPSALDEGKLSRNPVTVKTIEDYLPKWPATFTIECRESTELVEPGEEASAVFVLFTPTATDTGPKLVGEYAPNDYFPCPEHTFSMWPQTPEKSESQTMESAFLIVRSFIFSVPAVQRICESEIVSAADMEDCIRTALGHRTEIDDHGVGVWSSIMLIWIPEIARSCSDLLGRCFISQGEPGQYVVMEDLTTTVCDELAGSTPHLFFLTTSKIK